MQDGGEALTHSGLDVHGLTLRAKGLPLPGSQQQSQAPQPGVF